VILSAIAEKLKRRSKADFKGRHFEASLILQAVSWYLRYVLSYRDTEGAVPGARPGGGSRRPEPLGPGLRTDDCEPGRR
jgi:hypothetical protein